MVQTPWYTSNGMDRANGNLAKQLLHLWPPIDDLPSAGGILRSAKFQKKKFFSALKWVWGTLKVNKKHKKINKKKSFPFKVSLWYHQNDQHLFVQIFSKFNLSKTKKNYAVIWNTAKSYHPLLPMDPKSGVTIGA